MHASSASFSWLNFVHQDVVKHPNKRLCISVLHSFSTSATHLVFEMGRSQRCAMIDYLFISYCNVKSKHNHACYVHLWLGQEKKIWHRETATCFCFLFFSAMKLYLSCSVTTLHNPEQKYDFAVWKNWPGLCWRCITKLLVCHGSKSSAFKGTSWTLIGYDWCKPLTHPLLLQY